MPRGGLRPNSGRPKGRKNDSTLEIEEARVLLREMVFQELKPIAEAQIELAKGLWYEDAMHGRVYQQKPDKGAAELLLAHSVGKPKETLEHQGEIHIIMDV